MGRASKYGSTGKTVGLAELGPELVEGFCLVCGARTTRRVWVFFDHVCSGKCERKLKFDDSTRFAQVVKRLITKRCHRDIVKAVRKEVRRSSTEKLEAIQ